MREKTSAQIMLGECSEKLRELEDNIEIIAINGCCYGRDNKPNKGDYFKYCGQRFWEFISGNRELYKNIIEPLGHKAKMRNEEFSKEYSKIINSFTVDFSNRFCSDGQINWDALVEFNSSANV